MDPSACYTSGTLTCVLYLAFCHPVSPEVGGNCYNSAVCQKSYSEDDNYVIEYNMGAFTNYTHFYESKLPG